MRAKARFYAAVLGESRECVAYHGHIYFPEEAIVKGYFEPSNYESTCSFKGAALTKAKWFIVVVGGQKVENAAWSYDETFESTSPLAGFVGFYEGRGVVVQRPLTSRLLGLWE
mmetsp:Transcript_2961/g.7746  ORF Transcript_2961/g.7746 Transcript_2961/m.7746 type:complete len:113 (-) Transcript_2961:425-763(-)